MNEFDTGPKVIYVERSPGCLWYGFLATVFVIVMGTFAFWAINQKHNYEITGPGSQDLRIACKHYLLVGPPGRMAFLREMNRLAGEHENDPAGKAALELGATIIRRPEMTGYDECRDMLARIK